jgi:O-antigen/teichoic acid export membrane protein
VTHAAEIAISPRRGSFALPGIGESRILKFRRNLAAGLASSVWSAAVSLAVVPVYLKFLGIEAYGLIGMLATLQALFGLLDLGLAPAINREVARGTSDNNLSGARELLHTLTFIYWATALLICLISVAGAPFLAEHWLQSNHLSRRTLETSLLLMGLVVACRWPAGLYLGVLVGAQRIALSSGITILMSTIASLGAVAALAWISPRVETFFVWQAAAGLLNALAMRSAAWYAIGRQSGMAFSLPALKQIWRFSAGLSGIALSALLLTQVDKVVLSSSLTLSAFGQYSLATLVVSGLYLLVTPAFNVIYPRFTALVASGDAQGLTDSFRRGTRAFAIALSTCSMLLAVFAQDLVRVWTGDAPLARTVAPIIAVLAASVTLHGVMFFPYALQLAHGLTRLPLTIHLVLVAIAVPLMAVLAWQYQALGGALALLFLYVFYVMLGTWLTHRRLPRLVNGAWLFGDVCLPLGISLSLGLIGAFVMSRSDWGGVLKISLATALVLCNAAAFRLLVRHPVHLRVQ